MNTSTATPRLKLDAHASGIAAEAASSSHRLCYGCVPRGSKSYARLAPPVTTPLIAMLTKAMFHCRGSGQGGAHRACCCAVKRHRVEVLQHLILLPILLGHPFG